MKPIFQLFEDIWVKKEEKNWDYVYIMVDLHGVILKPNYHSETNFEFVSEYAEQCLSYLSNQEDVKLILWTSSFESEIKNVLVWLKKYGISFAFVNENPLEKNTEYADFSKKLYFSIGLDDKFGFEPNDWREINRWITFRELSKLK